MDTLCLPNPKTLSDLPAHSWSRWGSHFEDMSYNRGQMAMHGCITIIVLYDRHTVEYSTPSCKCFAVNKAIGSQLVGVPTRN